MRTIYISIVLNLFFYPAFTQTGNSLRLEDCYRLTIENAPLQQRRALVQQGHRLRLESIEAATMPTLDFNAQASVQSENVELPFEIPGMGGLDLPLYRFQSTVDAQYNIYTGGLSDAQEQQETAAFQAQHYQIDVELDKLKSQVQQLFFGVLAQEEKIQVLETSKQILQSKEAQLEAGLKHGVVLESDVDALRVELLRTDSKIAEAQGTRRGLIATLSTLIKSPIPETTEFVLPVSSVIPSDSLSRKELQLFALQKQQIASAESLIDVRKKPKLGAFVQAGVGYPNPLNFFEDKLSPFAVAGLRFTWNIWDWKQSDRDRQLIAIQQLTVDNQQAIFEQQIETTVQQILVEIETLNNLLEQEKAIVELEQKILKQKSAQLDNGVITSADYIEQVNKTQLAEQQLSQRRVAIASAKARLELLMGKG